MPGKSGILGEERIVDGMVAKAAVFFVGSEIADADARQILCIALINLLERQIFVLDIIGAGLHVFAVVLRGGDHGTSRADADAELARGGFVIRKQEAVADASAIGDVQIDGAIRVGGKDGGERARAKRQSSGDFFRIGFHAVQKSGVLIDESEEDHGDDRGKNKMPGTKRQRGEPGKAEDGGDKGQASGERANPAGVRLGLHILGKQEGAAEGDEVEFEGETTFPEGVAEGGLEKSQSIGQEKEESNGKSEPSVTLAENLELVCAAELPERFVAPLDIVSVVMGNKPMDEEEQRDGDRGQQKFPSARKLEPEEAVGRATEKQQET